MNIEELFGMKNFEELKKKELSEEEKNNQRNISMIYLDVLEMKIHKIREIKKMR